MIWHSSQHLRIVYSADFLTSCFSFVIAFFVYRIFGMFIPSYFDPHLAFSIPLLILAVVVSLFTVIIFDFYKAYSYQRFTALLTEYGIIFKVTFIILLFISLIFFLFQIVAFPRALVLFVYFSSIILFVTQKTILYYVAAFIRKKGKDRKSVIIIGTGPRCVNFIETVNENFKWGLNLIGIVSNSKEKVGEYVNNVPVIDHVSNFECVLKEFNPEEIIITISSRKFNIIQDVYEICEREGVKVRINSDFISQITKVSRIDNIYGLNILSFYPTHHSDIELLGKRILDIIGASLALLIYSPVMIIAAIGILISDGLPVFYRWNVIGRNKTPFRSWKFRTMVKNADQLKEKLKDQNEMEGPVFKITNDPRILYFGKWIRKFSIDETPQLISVIKGDMSLVGPRPAGPHELKSYQSWQRRKLSVKPGITCLWQIRGRNHINKFDDWVRLDLEYIDNWSLLLDIKILFRTVGVVLLGRGAS